MSKNRRNSKLMHERMTLILVLFFCVFISSPEFFVEEDVRTTNEVLQSPVNDSEDNQDQKTFLHSAIDAVVPFVVFAVDHVFHLIYEIIGSEAADFRVRLTENLLYNHYFEVLFEQIISVNAP
ncbi:MAG: hypothetical protein WD398_06695 [Cyclobacteriaceae bacterium]